MERVRAAVVGASGYVGSELLRILRQHPHVEITRVLAHRRVGERIVVDQPQLAGLVDDGAVYAAYDADDVARAAEVAFLALPHGESAKTAQELYARGVTVLDLSADLRLRSHKTYEEWYGEHRAPQLLPQAVYGLVERNRPSLKGAKLVAVPGCYPTAAILALAPLLDARLIAPEGIIIDAKSGTSGAGREPGRATHFAEMGEGVRAYKVAAHRHTPEIEQSLSLAADAPVRVTFTPHLLPMARGILATCYATPTGTRDVTAYREALAAAYAGEPFVRVVEHAPDTSHLRGCNRVQVAVWLDARVGRVIVCAAIDNLVKGAAGQAVQCLNVARGWAETAGLEGGAVFP